MRNSLYTNFYESVKRYPDRVAICTEQKQLSYLELNNRDRFKFCVNEKN